jgi:hypothetical protein
MDTRLAGKSAIVTGAASGIMARARADTQSLCAPFNRQSADKAPRLRRPKRAAAQKSTGLLPQRTHCYGCRPVDMATR